MPVTEFAPNRQGLLIILNRLLILPQILMHHTEVVQGIPFTMLVTEFAPNR